MINSNMPQLSLYKPEKSNDYKYFDRIISEQFTVGGTDLFIHKYLGVPDANNNISTTNIQDIIFLENRDRKYDPDIIRIRGHYNVQNLDFDLTQFGIFLTNDTIYITVHYNNMIDLVGRKLMVGDVLELPHLLDNHPLDTSINYALKRFYQVTDASYASEGFSSTWYPHLWRIKAEPITDSEEFKDILNAPEEKDNYLGDYSSTQEYPPGYVITFGNSNYESITNVPKNISPPNETYWKLVTEDSLRDTLSTYKRNIEINDSALEEARRNVPLSGYDTSMLYVIPTYDEVEQKRFNQPAPPIDIVTANGSPLVMSGRVAMMRNPKYKNPSPVIRIPKSTAMSLWDMTADMELSLDSRLESFIQLSLEKIEITPERTSSGSGSLENKKILTVQALGPITGPYGTSDNTYATSDQDPTKTGFTGKVTPVMNYRADCDPAFQYIARYSPRSFGYANGYLVGNGTAPNGYPVGKGISFPSNPKDGDYFLRIDYYPQLLYRWDGKKWTRVSENVRTLHLEWTEENKSQISSFINNSQTTSQTDGNAVPQRQALSSLLRIKPDDYIS
jgi:hypothetical protein